MIKRGGAFRNAGSWMNLTIVGIQFPICIVLGYLWGRWMDGLFGTAPYLMIIFSVFGIIAGFRNLFWIVGEAEKLDRQQARQAALDKQNEQSEQSAGKESASHESGSGDT